MHLGVDACCWSNRRGFGRFTRELVTRMVEEHPRHRYSLVVDRWTAAECELPSSAELQVVATAEQPTRAASARSARRPSDLWHLSRAASRLGCDAFFFPAVYSFYPLLRRVPTAVTFHDATAEDHPGLIFAAWPTRLLWRIKTRLALRQADRLLTVSYSARAQVAAAFGLEPTSIRVVSEAPSDCFRPLDPDGPEAREVRARYAIPGAEPIVLYVGGISPHKNLGRLVQAFASVARQSSCHLVLVGDHENDSFLGCHSELVKLRDDLNLGARISFTGFVPNQDLVALYANATLLVLPSLNEGFGLPAVEAMACGVPVAASRSGSLPEVLGDAGVFFDPLEVEQIARSVSSLLGDAELRRRQRARGLERVTRFSWSTAASQALQLLEEIAP